MSRILCIVDGMTDAGFIPADYPALGVMCLKEYRDTCRGGEPESLSCILHLLGVEDVPPYLRGYAEALGSGVTVGKRDLILRGSWFGIDEQGLCTLPIPAPMKTAVPACCRYVQLGEYRSLLIWKDRADCVEKIVTFPPYECAGEPAERLCPKGCAALEDAYKSWIRSGKCLIPWGQSVCAELPPFPQRAAVITGTTVVKGIAKLMGMDLASSADATGDVDTDLRGKCVAALAAAEKYPFVLLHINGADEAAHRKNPREKEFFLRRVDREVLRPLLCSGHEIIVTADHGTDPQSGRHLAVPQPVFVSR